MGYVLRVRLASFFAGAAVASTAGLYILYKDYKLAHHSISDQMKLLHDSLDERVSALEKLKETEVPQQPVEATE
ncbi:Brain aromatase [Bienertia sinuspersici]